MKRPIAATASFCLLLCCAALFPNQLRAQSGPVMIATGFPKVDLEITDLKRSDGGATVTLHGIVHNRSERATKLGYIFEIYLADFKNRRKYLVIHDSDMKYLCSDNTPVAVEAGGDTRFWAKFMAPPDAISALSVGWNGIEPALVPVAN